MVDPASRGRVAVEAPAPGRAPVAILVLLVLAWTAAHAAAPATAATHAVEPTPPATDAGEPSPGTNDADRPGLFLAVGRGADTLVVAPGQRRVCGRHQPMLVGTLEVREGERALVEGVDYLAEENEGCVELVAARADTMHLVVLYRYLPISGPFRYRLHTPESIGGVAAADTLPIAEVEGAGDAHLVVGGSKTFAVELGSRSDATLKQSLDLTLRGRLARDVSLEAVLSDRDSPVTPEGTSSELEELDKVLIRLQSPQGSATFGDIEVSQPTGEFARYERRLQGVEAQRASDRLSLGALAASAQGLFRSVEFFGVEGKQGPYRIGDVSGGRAVAVVPGTEDVFLDGQRLERGDNRDYTMDYALGELTFNLRRPVTFDSRVTVDFEEEVEAYDRRFLGGRVGSRPLSGASLSAFAISEADDRTSPRGFTLDAEETGLLEELGDAPPVGEAFAARLVGAGNGEYVKAAADSTAPEHFRWVGAGNGDYLVSFVRVGTLLGSYADSTIADGSIAYVFRGLGGGDFDPGRRLASPETHDLADLQLDWQRSAVSVRGELAASRHDLNTFSARDDADNDGIAGKGVASLAGPRWAGGRGGVRLSGNWRHLDADFSSFSRVNGSFDFLEWGYDPAGLTEGEDRRGLGLDIEPGEGGVFTAETGRLESGDAFEADRTALRYLLARKLRSDLRWEQTRSDRREAGIEGRRDVRHAEASYAFWRFVPSVTFRSESNEQDGDTLTSGNRFQLVRVATEVAATGRVRLLADYSSRLDDRRTEDLAGAWSRSSETLDRGARVELARSYGLQGSVEWRRRRLEARDASSSQTTNLARLAMDGEALRGAARGIVDYQVTTEEVFPRSKVITFVGDGRGNYDSLGVFVGTGDYDVSIVQSASRELLSRLDVAVRASIAGRQDPREGTLLRNVRLSSFVRVQNATHAPFGDLVNPFRGRFYTTNTETVESSASLRNDATFRPNGALSPRIRWEITRSFDGRFENVTEEAKQDVVALAVRAAPRPAWSIEVEGSSDRNENVIERVSPNRARASELFETKRLRTTGAVTPREAWNMSLETSIARTRKPGVEERERRIEVSPVVQFAPRRVGRIELRVRRVEIDGRLPRSRPSFAFGLSDASGVEWSTLADFRLKDYLTLAGTLRGTRPRAAHTLYEGRMELRAFF